MIPFVDLKAQYRGIQADVGAAIGRVLESADFVQGAEVQAFEEEFAAYCGTEHAIAVNTGTSALHLALLALGVGPGDEVVTVPFTFVATIAAIGYTGAKPVFVDVEPDSLTMDPARLEAAITPRTRAIMPVHLYGQVADMEGILDVGRRYGLPVVEDACQAHGAEYRRLRAGSIGEIGCFSFYPAKNLGAYGEGGAITTNDAALAQQMRLLRNWGAEQKYIHTMKGYNYRLPELQAAVLRVKLGRLEEWTEEIFFWMLSRYSGRLRATLRSWRVTTYPTAQMMVKARIPVIATAKTRGTRRASRRLTAGANKKASVRAKAKGMRSSRAKYRIRTVTASTRKGPTLENSVLRVEDIRPRGA